MQQFVLSRPSPSLWVFAFWYNDYFLRLRGMKETAGRLFAMTTCCSLLSFLRPRLTFPAPPGRRLFPLISRALRGSWAQGMGNNFRRRSEGFFFFFLFFLLPWEAGYDEPAFHLHCLYRTVFFCSRLRTFCSYYFRCVCVCVFYLGHIFDWRRK